MQRVKAAAENFDDGLNCAQSLAAAFGPGLGLDRETALRLAAPLGGGLSRTGGPCGAALGALLVIGLRFGHIDAADEERCDDVREKSRWFLERFAAARGGTSCPELLGADLSVPGEPERAKEEDLFQKSCPDAVRTAAEILVEMLATQENRR